MGGEEPPWAGWTASTAGQGAARLRPEHLVEQQRADRREAIEVVDVGRQERHPDRRLVGVEREVVEQAGEVPALRLGRVVQFGEVVVERAGGPARTALGELAERRRRPV